MTNKTKAIVMANKALREENRRLWGQIEEQERGMEEMHIVYGSKIMQLVQMLGEATLPKIDAVEYMSKYVLAAERHEDGSTTMRVEERTEGDDGTER